MARGTRMMASALLVAGVAAFSEPRMGMEKDVERHSSTLGWRLGARCASSEEVEYTFMLSHTDAQIRTLHETLMAVSDPDSASYGHHLTRDEVARIVELPGAVSAVGSWLRAAGHSLTTQLSSWWAKAATWDHYLLKKIVFKTLRYNAT